MKQVNHEPGWWLPSRLFPPTLGSRLGLVWLQQGCGEQFGRQDWHGSAGIEGGRGMTEPKRNMDPPLLTLTGLTWRGTGAAASQLLLTRLCRRSEEESSSYFSHFPFLFLQRKKREEGRVRAKSDFKTMSQVRPRD